MSENNPGGIKRQLYNQISSTWGKKRKTTYSMPQTWDGIVDASVDVPYVWLSREKDTDEWTPLRKEDCRVLNNCSNDETEIPIESGRECVNLKTLTITSHFFNYPPRKLCKAIWFIVKNPKGPILEPVLPLDDAEKIEELYQKVIKSTNCLAIEKEKETSEEVKLSPNNEFKAAVFRSADRISLRRKAAVGLGAMLDKGKLLQRGFGHYTVTGEDVELALGPVDHLIFAVHGVGEALWSSTENEIPSMKDEMNRTRRSIQSKQLEEWKAACERHKQRKSKDPKPTKPNRIEIIPIEWYDHIHSSSNSLMKSLNSVTLNSIPSLRAVANDVVFDVLMYMTPEFCQATLECVTKQINEKFSKFKRIHPHFKVGEGGKSKISLIGHSLGSVIVWDLLSIKKLHLEGLKSKADAEGTTMSGFSVFNSDDENPYNSSHQTFNWAPSLHSKMTQIIDFEPELTFFLGSPLGCMLTLRGAHEEFDKMIKKRNSHEDLETSDEKKDVANDKIEDKATLLNDKEKGNSNEAKIAKTTEKVVKNYKESEMEQKEPKTSTKNTDRMTSGKAKFDAQDMIAPFTLPTKSLYNVFHPSDPVAYRIEPLLLPRDLQKDDIPEPAVLATNSKGVRLHIKAKQFGRNLDSWFGKKKNNVQEVKTPDLKDKTKQSRPVLYDKMLDFPLGGTNRRVDFELQVGLIDNEYLSAVSAHTSYWSHEDMMDFIIQQNH